MLAWYSRRAAPKPVFDHHPLDELGRAFQIREQERDRSGWQFGPIHTP